MNRRRFLSHAAAAAALSRTLVQAQSPASQRARWVEIVEALEPRLRETKRVPVALVQPLADSTRILRWRMRDVAPASTLRERLMGRGDTLRDCTQTVFEDEPRRDPLWIGHLRLQALLEHARASGDRQTAKEPWPAAKRRMPFAPEARTCTTMWPRR